MCDAKVFIPCSNESAICVSAICEKAVLHVRRRAFAPSRARTIAGLKRKDNRVLDAGTKWWLKPVLSVIKMAP
ncbi:MAG TPA: hypothetical protein VM821_04595 [Abditibacteriaceae bacterium]|nr:hypothetical protein [Abditibacteriaceae bacterium]